jgi:predicted O-linked N-acetylglucosamine transferase (SPINDLY family)
MSDWICKNNDEYIFKAIKFSSDIKNLQKIKNDNASLYRKITRQLRNISKTESLYVNFETCNIIDSYIIKDNSIIIQFKKL